MTEAQWLACPVPGPMLALLRTHGREREELLFVAACLRRQPRLLADRPYRALGLVVRRAEGEEVSPQEWTAACALPWDTWDAARVIGEQAARAAWHDAGAAGGNEDASCAAELRCQADLLRCLAGDPFRPARVDPAWPGWRGGTVARLARAIDEERAFDRLPVLADALEEAGCTDPQLLGHGRSAAVHAPGCWLLDALLDRTARAHEVSVPDGGPCCYLCGAAVPDRQGGAPEGLACPGCALGGDYQLLEPVACDGNGVFQVWRARAPGGKEMAVKFLPRWEADRLSPSDAAALHLLPRLRHPCLLETFLYREVAGHLVLVTELAHGSLRDRLRECLGAAHPGIPAAELLGYIREASEALDYLHGRSVRHVWIRPNRLLRVDDGHIRVAADDAFLGHSGERPIVDRITAYDAPELWTGRGPCPASGQFALAISYAELRLGRLPFGEGTVFRLLVDFPREPPDLGSLPASEQAALLRALDREPARRYRDCRTFATALAAALGLPAPPLPPGPPAESRMPGLKGAVDRLTSLWRRGRR